MRSDRHNMVNKIREKLRILRYNFEQSSFGRLSNRLLYNLIALSAIPLILVVFFMRSVTQDSVSEMIRYQNILIARHIVSEIKIFFKIPNTLLDAVLNGRDLKEMNPSAQTIVLDRLAAQ